MIDRDKWARAGAFAGVVLAGAALVFTTTNTVEVHDIVSSHNGELAQLKAIDNRVLQQAHQYGAEQHTLVLAGQIEAEFATYLAETNAAICKALGIATSCPAVPTFHGGK